MPLPYAVAPILSITPPVVDTSRYRLKHFARWIRDDLDMRVAREGPDILRPDDVLTLHELFVTLRQSTSITALDLRATGIHKAVKDIAGIATRWPRRLCDDCDKIITIWKSRFGRFKDLHPFLYGRGGRLEGIASVSEHTAEALLQRWAENCPEKIHPSVAHRQGDLGFKAGDWWIHSLFAHHAGIIGLESVDGGTTYDKNGAYALLLKDAGEVDARTEEVFTYRCPISDKGKFRLTAATPASRNPIRVLQSHSINSVWGPKAGVRYEGLYSVKGWSIRQAKLKDTMGGEWKEGDILYEVTLQRKDPVPMDQVTCRPTNMEVDDYTEYKRLRKLYRDQNYVASKPTPIPHQSIKVAPAFHPLQLPGSPTLVPQSLLRVSPSVSRQTTFRVPAFNAPSAGTGRPSVSDVVSPMTVPGLQESFFATKNIGTLAIPTLKDNSRPASPSSSSGRTLREKQVRLQSPGSISLTSFKSSHSDLKEIIPWIDIEAQLPTPPALDTPPAASERKTRQPRERLEAKAAEMNPVKNIRRLARDSRRASDLSLQSQTIRARDTATSALNLRLPRTKPILPMLGGKRGKETEKDREKKRLTFGKKARFFDGADEEDDDCQIVLSQDRRFRSSSMDDLPVIHSPTPIRPPRPMSLFDYGIENIEFISPLDDVLPPPRAASPVNSPMLMHSKGNQTIGESIALGKLKRWLSK